jgi:predicted metalloprotease
MTFTEGGSFEGGRVKTSRGRRGAAAGGGVGLRKGHAASGVDTTTGVTFLDPITQAELSDALSAAQAVGDDHIQQQSSGGVNPDTWTHGSSAQRQRWFMTGYTQGTLAACDTFSAPSL